MALQTRNVLAETNQCRARSLIRVLQWSGIASYRTSGNDTNKPMDGSALLWFPASFGFVGLFAGAVWIFPAGPIAGSVQEHASSWATAFGAAPGRSR
jgi:hypothetical protein